MGFLRLALAICVFCSHSSTFGLPLLRGDVAVEVFFVISGFYMQLILGNVYTHERMGKDWLKKFYINRYLRLFPIYIATAGATFALAGGYFLANGTLENPLETLDLIGSLQNSLQNLMLKAFLMLTSITMLFQDVTMFIGIRQGSAQFVSDFSNSQILVWQGLAIPQAWTVGLELTFYIVAPFLLKLPTKRLLAVAAASFGAKATFLTFFNDKLNISSHFGISTIAKIDSLWGYRFFPFELCYFLVGAAAFRYFSTRASDFNYPKFNVKLFAYLLIFFAITIASIVFNKPGLCYIYPFAFAAVTPILFHLFGNSSSDRAIGELSYPFYITHILCLRIASPLEHLEIPGLTTVAGLILTFGCSAALIKASQHLEKVRTNIRHA